MFYEKNSAMTTKDIQLCKEGDFLWLYLTLSFLVAKERKRKLN